MPMHIDRILPKILEQSGFGFKKATVVSNLSRYVKYGDTFSRPAPNVYGLVDFNVNPDQAHRVDDLTDVNSLAEFLEEKEAKTIK